MRTSDIPHSSEYARLTYSFDDLLGRAETSARASWTDMPSAPGIYVVQWPLKEGPRFSHDMGNVEYRIVADPNWLRAKWQRINARSATDIIYIGKATDLRKRVRKLARFGVGKTRTHRGGEWMCQITEIRQVQLMVQECPQGQEVAFENWLLARFFLEHGEIPLANRSGPKGDDRWHP